MSESGSGGSFTLAGQRIEIQEWQTDTGALLRVATTVGLVVEHWHDADCDSVFPKGSQRNRELLSSAAVKCCEIEGEDWADCMRKYHQHLGWEPYQP